MERPLILGMDTTGVWGAVGLFFDGKKSIIYRSTKGGAEWLLPSINKLLLKNHKTLQNLSMIVVRTGPGSFTGTRIGVTVANALGWALGTPVLGVKNTEAQTLSTAVHLAAKLPPKRRSWRSARPTYPLLSREPS